MWLIHHCQFWEFVQVGQGLGQVPWNSQIWEYFPDFKIIPKSDLDTQLTDKG